MSCPSCGAVLAAGQDRCPACAAAVAPPVEGALAPDPASRARPEPLREIPGLKKRERTWKDEVRDRMRERKQRRGGELPLFRDAEEGEAPPEADEAAPPEAGREVAGFSELEPAVVEDRLVSTRVELGVDAADLPLRPAPVSLPERPQPERPPVERRLAEPPAEPPLAEDWSLGGEASEAPRPLERPAYSGERARAALLDLVLLGALWTVVVYFASRAARVGLLGLRPAWPYIVGYLAFLGLVYAGYFTGTTGQTLGKIATGLRVVDAGGRPPGYLRAFVRAGLGSLGVLLAGTGLVPMLMDPARRALHDRLARTRVVKG